MGRDQEVLVLYNNNPYARGPEFRERETADFRRRLAAEGITELAYATFPLEGDEAAGYTYAMLLDASEDKVGWVIDEMQPIVAATMETLRRATQ